MFRTYKPAILMAQALHDLECELVGLRDGAEPAVHQARVAIRRLREAMLLARGNFDEDNLGELEDRLSRAFKVLGRVRDADIAQALVEHVETRFPLASATLGQLRAAVAHRQLARRRKMIKTIEAVDLDALPRQLGQAYRAPDQWFGRGRAWRQVVTLHLAHRAEDVRHAMMHASGVYFPKRSHSARVAVKQLRYALELADVTGTRHIPRALRTLRKTQDALGQAHDREVLLDRLRDLGSDHVRVDKGESHALEQFFAGEVHSLYARYLESRDDILKICAACSDAPRGSALVVRTAAAAALAVPAVMVLRRH